MFGVWTQISEDQPAVWLVCVFHFRRCCRGRYHQKEGSLEGTLLDRRQVAVSPKVWEAYSPEGLLLRLSLGGLTPKLLIPAPCALFHSPPTRATITNQVRGVEIMGVLSPIALSLSACCRLKLLVKYRHPSPSRNQPARCREGPGPGAALSCWFAEGRHKPICFGEM